jgi:hypothetical protein
VTTVGSAQPTRAAICLPGTALRTHPEALPLLAEWTDAEHAALADLDYEGERAALTTPIKHSAERRLTDDQRTVNLLHAAVRAPAKRCGIGCWS